MSTRNKPDTPDDIESGTSDIRQSGSLMSREDKIVFGIAAGLFLAICVGIMLLTRWFLGTFFGMFQAIDSGIGIRDAFLTGTGLSFLTIISFAIVAGEGVVGELPTMIVGLFILIIFFTLSIAMVF